MDKLEFTIVIIGDDEVGKWELLETQIGSENVIRECHTASIHEGPRTDIKYVNIPSAQRYIKLAPRYWTSAAAIVFVFDQNDRDSFISISTWLSAQQDFDQIQLFLIVNVHQQTVGNNSKPATVRFVQCEQVVNSS